MKESSLYKQMIYVLRYRAEKHAQAKHLHASLQKSQPYSVRALVMNEPGCDIEFYIVQTISNTASLKQNEIS